MTDPVRPTGMLELNATPRIDTKEIREYPWCGTCTSLLNSLCDEIDILRGELASAEFAIRRRECLDALKAAIEKAKTIEGHAHG